MQHLNSALPLFVGLLMDHMTNLSITLKGRFSREGKGGALPHENNFSPELGLNDKLALSQ